MAETTPLQQPSVSQPISDLNLEHAVQDVLRSADLNSITKREIRCQLESHFRMDLSSRKAVINATIDRTLLEQNYFFPVTIFFLLSLNYMLFPLFFFFFLSSFLFFFLTLSCYNFFFSEENEECLCASFPFLFI